MPGDVRLANLHERIARLRWALYGLDRHAPGRQAVELALLQCYYETFAVYSERLGLDVPAPQHPPAA
jgi:hypothetical protein